MVIILFVMRSEEKLLGVAFLIPMYLSVRQLSIYLMTLLYHYGKGGSSFFRIEPNCLKFWLKRGGADVYASYIRERERL